MSRSRVTGLAVCLRAIRNVRDNKTKALRRGLKKAGLFLQRESQKVVPVDTGALRNSAFTREATQVGTRRMMVIVGYSTYYAIYVHEILSYRHAEGKMAKYLERPAREHSRRMSEIIWDEVKNG